MGKLFVFMGKSASGKDTLYHELMKRHKELGEVVPYTTRPMRANESEGEDYHFVTEDRMYAMRASGDIVESRCYQTVKGLWYYFTADDGQIDLEKRDFVLISTLEGYEQIRNYYGSERVVPLYIEVEDMLRMQRSLERESRQEEPCVAEVCRRFLADEIDFSEEKRKRLGITDGIENESLEEALAQIERRIAGDQKK